MKRLLLVILSFGIGFSHAQDPQSGWRFSYNGDNFTEDAILDLRYLNESVAGENGFIRLSEDGNHFVNDLGEIRFWATNGGQLVRNHDPKLTDAELAEYARFLAKMGVNMIRFHGEIFSTNLILEAPNKEEADYIWRVVAAMKQEGIYTTISPFWPRHMQNIPANWGLGDYVEDKTPWALMYFDEHFQNAYKSWVTYLYTETNPHTGIALKDDPAVGLIQIQNEDGVFFWTIGGVLPSLARLMQEQFYDWTIAKYADINNAYTAWQNTSLPEDNVAQSRLEIINIWFASDDPNVPDPTEGFDRRLTDQMNFFADVQKDFYQEMYDHYRSMGCQQLINANNWKTASAINLFDLERYTNTPAEVMAVNRYYSPGHYGPNAGWRIERLHHYQGNSNMYAPDLLPINIKQVAGRPFIVSESGWNLPHKYQAEGPFLIAAYQSLTGVDAFYWFDPSATTYEDDPYWPYFGEVNGEEPMYRWTTSTPGQVGMFPANALAFRKGYIKRGNTVLHEERTFQAIIERQPPKITEDNSYDPNRDNYDPNPSPGETEYSPLTYLAGPVEVVYDGNPDNTTSAPNLGELVNTSAKTVTSITGELKWDYKQGICILDAPKIQGICGFPAETEYNLSDVSITSSNDYVVINVVSMDDQTLSESEKIFMQIGTVYQPAGWKEVATSFTPDEGAEEVEGFRIESLGSMPWVCANTEVKFEIKNKKVKSARLLTSAGYEGEEFFVSETPEGLSFDLPKNAMYVLLDTRASQAPEVPMGLMDKSMDKLKIYPNPSIGYFQIIPAENGEGNSISQIELLDLKGKHISTYSFIPGGTYPLPQSAGTYLVQLQFDDGLTRTQKLIVAY